MKSISFAVALLVSSILFAAQNPKELKGPQAKNFKPWMKETPKMVVVKKSSLKSLKGPSFKNHKTWEVEKEQPTKAFVTKPRTRVTGPKAKNKKPWEN